MKPSFAALVAVLLLVTACRKPPPPATSIAHELIVSTMSIVIASLAR